MHNSVPEGLGATPPTVTDRLSVRLRTRNKVAVVSPAGELDHDTVSLLRASLDQALAAEGDRVVVDCRELLFCDSTGLNLLLTTRLKAEAAELVLVLAGLRPTVARMFEITGTDTVFDIRSDVGEAVAR
ncbi:STAS domain-containing protein [Kitasatospora sp. NPDC052896]|uniref:STAS domain-containing protein n=1 Tax=Kitasatospora sp. NPDC052896 TaxID=3364061 RepID=UPI0037C77D55